MSLIDNLIRFERGTIPLIISVPHGGKLECESIPERVKGVLGIDKSTIKLAQNLISHIKKISKLHTSIEKSPSYIISHIRRSKIDLNRKEGEAFNTSSTLAKDLYQLYHKTLKSLILENLRSFNQSLLIDIHGFEKKNRPSGFRDVELIFGTNNLESFYSETLPKKSLDSNLRGNLINKFLELNIPIAPGHPKRKEYVLTGGYITKQYGASHIPKSKAIQIEFSDRVRLFDKDLRNVVLLTLAEIFFKEVTKI